MCLYTDFLFPAKVYDAKVSDDYNQEVQSQSKSYHIILYHITSYDIILIHITSHHIISIAYFIKFIAYHIISYHIISYSYHTISNSSHTIPYHTISYHIQSYHINHIISNHIHTILYQIHPIPYHTIPYHTIQYHTQSYLITQGKICQFLDHHTHLIAEDTDEFSTCDQQIFRSVPLLLRGIVADAQ